MHYAVVQSRMICSTRQIPRLCSEFRLVPQFCGQIPAQDHNVLIAPPICSGTEWCSTCLLISKIACSHLFPCGYGEGPQICSIKKTGQELFRWPFVSACHVPLATGNWGRSLHFLKQSWTVRSCSQLGCLTPQIACWRVLACVTAFSHKTFLQLANFSLVPLQEQKIENCVLQDGIQKWSQMNDAWRATDVSFLFRMRLHQSIWRIWADELQYFSRIHISIRSISVSVLFLCRGLWM